VQDKKKPADDGHGHKKSANQYANWWETSSKPIAEKTVHDNTPDHIKNDPTYQAMIDRFMPEYTKDNALENERNDKTSGGIDHSVIGEEKEREGYYPNELDDEIRGYKYGDKVDPGWNRWGGWDDGAYRGNQYKNIYDAKNRSYNPNNKYDRKNGWGFRDVGKIAPPYDRNAHFETPYYNYDDQRWGAGYWNRMRNGPY